MRHKNARASVPTTTPNPRLQSLITEENEDEVVIISGAGDIVLDVVISEQGKTASFRVESTPLKSSSPYFGALLNGHFVEGQSVQARHAFLQQQYPDISLASDSELPHITLSDLGAISKVNAARSLIADFLRILHGLDLPTQRPPVPNLANLAIIADRLDVLPVLTRYVERKRYLQSHDANTKIKAAPRLTEERIRQKILVGLLLDHGSWVTVHSKELILKDSIRWRETAPSPSSPDAASDALWWDLPLGIEEELIFRRECVLETISSLQMHFLKIYTSGERQCRLGYDTSAECDSFQLGEMMKFFSRLGTLRQQSLIYDIPEETGSFYQGDASRLLETLRSAPSYQLPGHTHCGLRSRLIPLLDTVQNLLSLDSGSLDVGICLECWRKRREEYAWSSARKLPLWTPSLLTKSRSRMLGSGLPDKCLSRHQTVRDMFLAGERDWTSRDSY